MSNVEDTNNSSDLSEFFSALSKEKKESRQKLEEEIANPESGLSNLFKQLEEAHRETQKVSEEIPDSKSLSPDDQNQLEAFSSLMNSVDVSLQEVQEETPEIEEIALNTMRCLGLTVGGIDLLFNEQSFKVCEANSAPGWIGFQEATGINVAAHLVDLVKQSIGI